MPSHCAFRVGRLFGFFLVGTLVFLTASPAPSPVHAAETCPCFAAEEISQVCESIGEEQTYGPSRGWGGLIETEGAAIECSSRDRGEGAFFEVDARPMKFSAMICTKIISRGTQDDVLQTEGIFEEHLVACRQQLERAADLLGGLKFLRFER